MRRPDAARSPASPSRSSSPTCPSAHGARPDRPRGGLARGLPLLLVVPDLALLYAGFAVGFKARLGVWVWPHLTTWGTSIPLIMGVYVVALAASGLYRRAPRAMRLGAFLRTGLALIVAWAVSIALTYLVVRGHLPPRSVTAIHCLFAIVGILGLRATVRYAHERLSDSPPAVPAAAPLRPEPLRLGDLVPRDDVALDRVALRSYLSDRTVLVTGAGGSIGATLCEQLVALRPFRLVLVDHSEYNLYRLEQRLHRLRYDGEVDVRIADVRDDDLMDALFARHRPDVVLHAAAYKHVPMMERHPAEAFRNNTLATVRLLDRCDRFGAEQFVFVSTDKAVEPASVMGATKRLAEWYVQTATSDAKRTVVRFGNVFGSRGSVVPFFEERLAEGEPLPVTHPDMERYFMSSAEACSLILQTLVMDDGPVYVFRMGEPVRIAWLAREMVRRRRPEAAADPDAWIRFTGRRPGEKLTERLQMPYETAHATDHPGIVALRGAVPYSRAEVELHLSALARLCRAGDASTARLRKALFAEHLTTGDEVRGE